MILTQRSVNVRQPGNVILFSVCTVVVPFLFPTHELRDVATINVNLILSAKSGKPASSQNNCKHRNNSLDTCMSPPWIPKGVFATLQSGRYTLSYPKGRCSDRHFLTDSVVRAEYSVEQSHFNS